ncbi:MAG: radical SAM protein [Planctomycetota bacterium]
MRASFRHLAWEQLRHARLRALLRAGSTALKLRLGRTPRAPLFVTLAVTYRCNHRCVMCNFPQRAERRFPSRERLQAVLNEFARRGSTAVGITGGEPTLRPDLELIIRHARSLGLIVHLNSNGSAFTWGRARSLLAAGLASINISLDGACAETHDRLRRTPGSFARIVEGVARLLLARKEVRARTAIRLVMALARENAAEIEPFVELGARLRVNGMGFLPVHPLVASAGDPFDAREKAELEQRLSALLRGPHAHLIDNSAAYLAGIPPFLAGEETPERCSAPRSHVAIDPGLGAYACVPLMTVGRARLDAALSDWNPAAAMRKIDPELCRRCWWNCHREVDIALGHL